MLSIIDRYIARLFLGYFLGGLVVFVTIFLAVDFMGTFNRYHVDTAILFDYYKFYLPDIVYQMFPVACLLATVFTLANMNKNNELVALHSAGVSMARVCAPILAIVAILSALFFWMGDRVLPVFAQKKNYVKYVEIEKKPSLYSTVKTNKIWYRSENILFNIKTLVPDQKEAQGLTLYYFDSAWNLVQVIKAQSVQMRGQTWQLDNGEVTVFATESSFPLSKPFAKKIITVNEDLKDLQNTATSAKVMSLHQLSQFIQKNKSAGLNTLNYEVDYEAKIGFGFAAFVMSLIGIPFSVKRQRSGTGMINVGVCIGLTFAYWVLFSSALTLGRHGVLAPVLSAWLPNGGMASFALFLLFRQKR